MNERRLLCSQDEVRALQEGRMTLVIRPSTEVIGYPGVFDGDCGSFGPCGYKGIAKSDYWIKNKKDYAKNPEFYHIILGRQEKEINPIPIKCPFGAPGTRLWVAETFAVQPDLWAESHNPQPVHYPASTPMEQIEDYIIKPSTQMPHWASRLKVENVGIRVARVQDLTENETRATGIKDPYEYQSPEYYDQPHICEFEINKAAFAGYWDSRYSKKGLSWDANPWCWIGEVRRVD